ncbi:MAG: hypothetical protein J2P13_02110 [Acidobacteria bacterium]|nr:hypothetical protein [Acidobacteriota bacterium]
MRAINLLRSLSLAGAMALLLGFAAYRLRAAEGNGIPHIEFHADNMGPRAIEELTAKSVPRDYALAWQTMEQALEENQAGLLDGYFTGPAKDDLTGRVRAQIASGLLTRYRDRGHRLEGIFYSPSGDAMELRDHAEIDLEVLDGGRVIYSQPVTTEYLVLMTPGADRWLVRQIQATDGKSP